MKRPAHMTLVDADKFSALVSRCTELRERAEKAEARIEALEKERDTDWRNFVRLRNDNERIRVLGEELTKKDARIEALERENGETYRMKADRNRGYAMFYRQKALAFKARIEALEKWGEGAEQALVYAATVTDNPMVDKVCMDRAVEWAAFTAEEKP